MFFSPMIWERSAIVIKFHSHCDYSCPWTSQMFRFCSHQSIFSYQYSVSSWCIYKIRLRQTWEKMFEMKKKHKKLNAKMNWKMLSLFLKHITVHHFQTFQPWKCLIISSTAYLLRDAFFSTKAFDKWLNDRLLWKKIKMHTLQLIIESWGQKNYENGTFLWKTF